MSSFGLNSRESTHHHGSVVRHQAAKLGSTILARVKAAGQMCKNTYERTSEYTYTALASIAISAGGAMAVHGSAEAAGAGTEATYTSYKNAGAALADLPQTTGGIPWEISTVSLMSSSGAVAAGFLVGAAIIAKKIHQREIPPEESFAFPAAPTNPSMHPVAPYYPRSSGDVGLNIFGPN